MTARYVEAACELCHREGQRLLLKGERYYIDKYGVGCKAYAPDQRDQGRKKTSEYGPQLHAKQMIKRLCGVLESQLRDYYNATARMEGKTGDLLLGIFESRPDNVVRRLGWGSFRAEVHQLIVHGRFIINGKRVDILSYLIKPGEAISVKKSSHSSDKVRAVLEVNASCPVPKRVEFNRNTLEAKVLTFPERENIELVVDEILIVELYPK